MENIRGYLLSVVAVCMLCALGMEMLPHGRGKGTLRLIGGLMVLLVILKPIPGINIGDLSALLETMDPHIDRAQVEQQAADELCKHIKETAESYIETEAKGLGASIQAEVTLTRETYPVPCAVRIVGTLTAEQKKRLSSYLEQELGVEKKEQEWDLYGTVE